MVTYPSTNRARRRVTSLIETNALTTKPGHHHHLSEEIEALLLCSKHICLLYVFND